MATKLYLVYEQDAEAEEVIIVEAKDEDEALKTAIKEVYYHREMERSYSYLTDTAMNMSFAEQFFNVNGDYVLEDWSGEPKYEWEIIDQHFKKTFVLFLENIQNGQIYTSN